MRVLLRPRFPIFFENISPSLPTDLVQLLFSISSNSFDFLVLKTLKRKILGENFFVLNKLLKLYYYNYNLFVSHSPICSFFLGRKLIFNFTITLA